MEDLLLLKEVVLKHFGTQSAVAMQLNIQQPAVSQWKNIIPEDKAFRLRDLTEGVLQYEEKYYRTTQVDGSEAVA